MRCGEWGSMAVRHIVICYDLTIEQYTTFTDSRSTVSQGFGKTPNLGGWEASD